MMHPKSALFVALLSLALLPAAPPATAAPVVTITTDRPEALYGKNEEVEFSIQVRDGDAELDSTAVDWTLSLDGYKDLATGKGNRPSGSLDHPGFLLLAATYTAADGKKTTAFGGAGVAVDEIAPSLAAPEDFDAFWAAQKKALAEVPLTFTATPHPLADAGDAGLEAVDLTVACETDGPPVSGYFVKPKNAAARSLPAVLWVHGAGVRSASLPAALAGARDGFLSLDINAHGIANGKPGEYYKALSDGELKNYRHYGNDDRENIYFRGMFVRLMRAIDFLTTRPEWDGKTLAVIGHSQGGLQALVAGGLDERVTFIGSGVPAGCDHTGMKADRISGWPKIVPRLDDGSYDPAVIEASRYIDAVNFAARCKAEAIVSVGFIDRVCPPTSVYAAYNVLPGKKSILNYPAMGHAATSEIREKFREALLRHAGKSAAPRP